MPDPTTGPIVVEFTDNGEAGFPTRVDVRVRQGDLGRDGSVSTIGMARWLEDARLRVRMRRFERLVGSGGFGPLRILLAGQHVERLARADRSDGIVQVRSGVRRIGRSSFTIGHAVFAGDRHVGSGEATIVLAGPEGPRALPDELIADLRDVQSAEPDQATVARPGAERQQRDHYAHFFPLHARIGDVDINDHVNFISLAGWYDEAVSAFALKATGTRDRGPVPDLSPWSYRIHYTGEVTYPGDYDIGILIRSLDGDSVHYEMGVFRDGTCLGVADAVGARGELPAEWLEASLVQPGTAP
ncbi:hypothetical protein ACFOVU_08895 [Nocardiopsis sediminis]|uniref:Thioesterase n=1 Tax=Nocardiopsis sediminis TaxID=1778267 RepID=A0ABV8FN28_9ACTN